jgi:alpha-L-rhamnosidase
MRTRSVAVAVSALLVAAPVAYAPSANGQGNDSSLTASSLRADYRVDPLGIDDATPDLSWTVASRQRDQVQTAYEVRAATSEPGLSQPDLWDTGRVTSAQSTDVVYAGAAVHSRLRVFWQLRVWDASGRASAWSPTAFWEMGLQSSSDWQAKWITDKRYSPPEPHPVMVHVPPQDARYLKLDVTKLGLPLKEGFPSPVSRLQLAEIAVTDSSDASGADLARGAGGV